MVFGDGAIIRAALGAILDLLRKFAGPTGERGSILLMAGGLVVLGFLFLALIFRSAIVGDLAPVANARRPSPRAALPSPLPRAPLPPPTSRSFEEGRRLGHEAGEGGIDGALSGLAGRGVDARIVRTRASWSVVRIYSCASCASGQNGHGCEYERGLLAGAFESLTDELAKVHEIECVGRGGARCEFEVRHAPLVEVA